ncbi:MAG: hypothetical protein NUV80_05385 [Candidatus Berkelbacteria bacterium]|nr:hypothetical protein [Candidatus Berkelbacteria bacterium]
MAEAWIESVGKVRKLTARIIVISGIDGSGKSTIIEGVERVLLKAGHSTYTPWLRYNHYLTKGVFALAKLFGLYSYDIKNGKRVAGYHDFYRSRLISIMFVLSTFVDTLFASLVKVYIPAYVLRKTVICDRWVPDILIDIAIDTGKSSLEKDWVWKLMWKLVPNSAKALVIMRGTQDVLDSRKENRNSRNFDLRLSMYKQLCELVDGQTIDNSGSVSQSVNQVKEIVFS